MTFHSWSESEIITILVGKQEIPCRVHRDLLIRSSAKFFIASLQHDVYEESRSNVIRLPDDKVIPVRMFIDWLYIGSLGAFQLQEWTLVAYQFADKIMAEKCSNFLMDCIRASFRPGRHNPHVSTLVRAKRIGLGGTPFYKFTLKSIVSLLQRRPTKFEIGRRKTSLNDMCAEMDVMQDVMQELVNYNKNNYGPPRDFEGCHFHRHEEGTACTASTT